MLNQSQIQLLKIMTQNHMKLQILLNQFQNLDHPLLHKKLVFRANFWPTWTKINSYLRTKIRISLLLSRLIVKQLLKRLAIWTKKWTISAIHSTWVTMIEQSLCNKNSRKMVLETMRNSWVSPQKNFSKRVSRLSHKLPKMNLFKNNFNILRQPKTIWMETWLTQDLSKHSSTEVMKLPPIWKRHMASNGKTH